MGPLLSPRDAVRSGVLTQETADMMRSGFFFRPLAFGFFMLFAGCYGAYQVRPDAPAGAGPLKPSVEEKDIGRGGIADGFNLTAYQVVLVDSFPVTDPAIKDEGDRRFAASMTAFLQSELVRRLRESGLFVRVVNLTETEWRPGPERALGPPGQITPLRGGPPAGPAFLRPPRPGKAHAPPQAP